jgi:long-chain fatty acid transport protein
MKNGYGIVLLFPFLFLLFLNGSAFGDGGFALSGVGSKALSLGGAFRGLADDWSASFWNPAGLAFLPKSEFSFNFYTFNFRPQYTAKAQFGQDGYVYSVGYVDATFYPEDQALFLPSFSGFYKFPQLEGFSGGIAFFVPYKLQSKWDIYKPPDEYVNTVPYPKFDHETNILIWDLHPTVAKDFMEGKLSLGAGLSIQRAHFELRRVVLTPTIYPRPYEYFPVDWYLKTNGWGLGFNLGILYKASPKLQFGFSYRSPVDISLKGRLDLEMYFPTAKPYYEGGTYNYSNGNFETTLPLAGDLGVGIAFKPLEKLTLTFDVNSTNWSRLDKLETEDFFLTMDTSGYYLNVMKSELPFDWDNVTRFSLGGEYLFGENLYIRGGYFFEKSPIPNSTFTMLIPDVGNKNCFNVGLSYRLNAFELGYNYELVAHKRRIISSFVDQNGDGLFDNLPGDYKMTQHLSCFSFTYHF